MPEPTIDFKQWFGKSTVVDEAGAPLVVYHGTDTVFSDFKYGEFGFHFGSRESAESRGEILMEVHLLIEKPIVFDIDFSNWDEEFVGPYLVERGVITEDEMNQGDLQSLLMEKGYDGYRYPNGFEGGGMSFAVFSPEQIKSIHHVGPYDRSSTNIHGEAVIQTPQARNRAFGEWIAGSTVADAEGVALEVYHGTDAQFDAFNGPAFFTDSISEALEYGANLKRCFLNIKNPKALDSFDQMQALRDDEIPRYAALGYDGFVGEGADGTHYVVFSPAQIQSSVGIDPALAVMVPMEPPGPDWGKGSKVVGDDGALLTVFHGTKQTFDQFKVPAWFTPDYKMADHFSASPGEDDDEERTPHSKVMAVHLDIKNPLLTDDWHVTENLATRNDWRKKQMAAGHDGVKFTSEEGEVEYIAFHANQIRIVDGFDKKAAAEKALDFLHHLPSATAAKVKP